MRLFAARAAVARGRDVSPCDAGMTRRDKRHAAAEIGLYGAGVPREVEGRRS